MSKHGTRIGTFAVGGIGTLAVGLAISTPAAQTGAPVECFGKPVTIQGGNGNSNINGTNANDVIDAGDGENDVNGKQGNDRICGGRDGDDLFGDQGNDKLAARGSIDFVAGNQGDDLHIGGGGDDQIDAVQDSLATDEDVARGAKGQFDYVDVLDGEGNDRVSGGAGANDECPADAGDEKRACEF